MEIGQRFKKIRKDKGITRTALAKQIDMSDTNLYRIEVGEQTPPLPVIERIASALGVPLGVIFEDEEYSVSKEADETARRVAELLRSEVEKTPSPGMVPPKKAEIMRTLDEYERHLTSGDDWARRQGIQRLVEIKNLIAVAAVDGAAAESVDDPSYALELVQRTAIVRQLIEGHIVKQAAMGAQAMEEASLL